MAHLSAVKARHPFAVREVPISAERLPLVRATLGLHHALRRLGVCYPLAERLAELRVEAHRPRSG
jgi:hypothetical protein